jgi:HPt (histidine-containing phosphotransfer) domain-containing protein
MKEVPIMLNSNLPVIGEEAEPELLKLLTTSLKEFRVGLDRAYFARDVPQIIKEVHKMHGALCYTDTPQLKEAVKSMEIGLQNGAVDQLDSYYQTVLAAIQTFDQVYAELH